jgi:lysophospholipase L1-like esterase
MKRDWSNKPFQTLVTLGESTTAGGWSSSRDRCWVEQLAKLISDFQRVPVQLINSGIGANVISTVSPCYEHSGKPAANERLEKHVIDHKPDLLVISYGLNDARGGTPLDLFCDELKLVIGLVREHIQPLILLPGPYFMTDFNLGAPYFSHADLDLFKEYNKAIGAVAEETDCIYVDLLTTYREAPWLIHHDGCHANDLGHRLVANKMFEVLASNCSGLAIETQELEKHIPPWRDESTLKEDYGYSSTGKVSSA